MAQGIGMGLVGCRTDDQDRSQITSVIRRIAARQSHKITRNSMVCLSSSSSSSSGSRWWWWW